MNDERKDELGRLFIFQEEISTEELKKLEIQEIIFLIASAQHVKETKTFALDKKIAMCLNVLTIKIKEAEELFIAYEKNTDYPYIDNEGGAWIFSKEEYANTAADYFAQQQIILEIKKIRTEEIMKTFTDLHRTGIEKILVDNGHYSIEMNRDDILAPPDYANTPMINIPVTNPKLQYAIIRFFQRLYSQDNSEGKDRMLNQLQDDMIAEVLNATYLLPMQLNQEEPAAPDEQGKITIKKGATINFAKILDKNDASWLPAFTDWAEFEKIYDKKLWQGNIATYDDLLTLAEKMAGIVINCNGIPLQINEDNKQMIEEYKYRKNNPKAASVEQFTVKKDTEVLLGEPKEYPAKMIEAIKEYMKTQKAINKAYLRLMVRDNEKSYLIVVDFAGRREEIFKGIADAAMPYLNGMFLDMLAMDDWAKNATQDVKPFYRKKRFGLF